MPRYINPYHFADIVEKPFLKRDFKTYDLGGGYGNVYKMKKRRGNSNMAGHIINVTIDSSAARLLFQSIKAGINHNFSKHVSFFLGLLIFCYKDISHKIKYVEMDIDKYQTKIRKCVENLEFPVWAEEPLKELWESDVDFEEYLEALMKVPDLDFDFNSALLTYRMQGDDAIFGILCQIYTLYHQKQVTNIKLIPDLPIIYMPPVSDFVSGVFFPVVVTKFNRYWTWEDNDEGIFLIDEDGNAIDCVRSGTYNCGNDPLFNRLGLLYHSKHNKAAWRVCWNWGEIVEAVGFFGGDVLVRGLSEGILRADWRRFGVNGLLVVNCFKGGFAGSGYRIRRPDKARCLKSPKIDFDKNKIISVNLLGEKVDVEPEGRVLYSNEELEDWFELGELCKNEINARCNSNA